MNTTAWTVIAAIIAAASSSGICSIVLYLIQRKDRKADQGAKLEAIDKRLGDIDKRLGAIEDKDKKRDTAIIAQLHSSLYKRSSDILTEVSDGTRTCIDTDDFHDLSIMYKAYREMGGNGTCEILFDRVKQIPLKQTNAKN